MNDILDRLRKGRAAIYLFLVVAFLAMLLLAAGLSSIELKPGQPFPFRLNQGSTQGAYGNIPGGTLLLFIIRMIYLVGLVTLPFFVIYLIVSPKARKQFLRDLRRALLFAVTIYLFARMIQLFAGRGLTLGERGNGQPAGAAFPDVPLAQFNPRPPEWLVLVVSLVIALALTALVGGLTWWLLVRRRRQAGPIERIARHAQSALDALQAGSDLKNTVIRCYYEMSRVLREERGIQRGRAMTTREFEADLESRGLPGQHVRQLTRIFEDVRYGALQPSKREELMAIDSLEGIVEACRSSR
jgi:hypothetical protein